MIISLMSQETAKQNTASNKISIATLGNGETSNAEITQSIMDILCKNLFTCARVTYFMVRAASFAKLCALLFCRLAAAALASRGASRRRI
jgi:hypothetical protein